MRAIIVFGFILGLACLLVFATALPAWACRCPSRGPRQHFKTANLVFQGIAERETVNSHIFFRVEKTWKGLKDVQEVDLKFRNLERCGVNPTMGHSFVIFSGKKEFDSCDIKETIDSEKEISFLDSVNPVKPVGPVEPGSPVEQGDQGNPVVPANPAALSSPSAPGP